MKSLKADFYALVESYWRAFRNAPARSEYVYGTRTKSKFDIRREFNQNLKELKQIAKMYHDDETVALIEVRQKDELESLKSEIEDDLGPEGE